MTAVFRLESHCELRSSVIISNNEVVRRTFEGSLEQVLKEEFSYKLVKTLIESDLLKIVKVDSSSIPNHTQFECRLILIKD